MSLTRIINHDVCKQDSVCLGRGEGGGGCHMIGIAGFIVDAQSNSCQFDGLNYITMGNVTTRHVTN